MQREKRRPNGSNHHSHGIRAVHVLDRVPEYREDSTRYDGDVGAPEAPGGAREYGEGHVVDYADCAVGGDYEGDYKEC